MITLMALYETNTDKLREGFYTEANIRNVILYIDEVEAGESQKQISSFEARIK